MLKRLAGYFPIPLTEDHKVAKTRCSCFQLKLKCFFLIGALLLTIILWSWLSYTSHVVKPSAHPGTHQREGIYGHHHDDDSEDFKPQKGGGSGLVTVHSSDFKGSVDKPLLGRGAVENNNKGIVLNPDLETKPQDIEEVKQNATQDLDVDIISSKRKDVDDDYDDDDDLARHYDAQHSHVGTLKRRLPKSILIGVSKAGTSALLFFLNMHPKVRIAWKEVHFFDVRDSYSQGLEWYVNQMPVSYADQITIEKTPSYFVSIRVAKRVQKMDSSLKLMVIVREPVSRAISQYLLMRKKFDRHNLFYPSFESLAINSNTGNVNKSFKAVRSSIYYEYMKHWLAYFPRSQILVIDGDNLRKFPWEEINKVESFLGIDHVIEKDRFIWNQSKHFYCFLTDLGEQNCLPDYKGRPHPYIDEDVIQKLKDFYRPWNEKFFDLVDQNFDWD